MPNPLIKILLNNIMDRLTKQLKSVSIKDGVIKKGLLRPTVRWITDATTGKRHLVRKVNRILDTIDLNRITLFGSKGKCEEMYLRSFN